LKSVEMRRRYDDYSIFQDGGRRHLGFSKFQTFDGRTAQKGRIDMRRSAKFGRNRSKCGGDMTIFRFFKMAAAAILDFQNFKL